MAHVPDVHYNTILKSEMMDSFQTAYEHFVNAPTGGIYVSCSMVHSAFNSGSMHVPSSVRTA